MKQKIYKICKLIFFISLLEYIGWLGQAIIVYIKGIDTNWFISSLGKSEIVYGWAAVNEVCEQFLLITILIAWPLRLFQFIMLILIIREIIKKRNEKKGILDEV